MGEQVKVLSRRNVHLISRRTGSRPTCYRCGEPLRIGEKILIKPAKKRSTTMKLAGAQCFGKVKQNEPCLLK